MKSKSFVFLTFLVLAGTLAAKDPEFQRGILLSVDSSACNAPDNTPTATSQRKKARDFQCQEYILQSEHFLYRLRPVNEKHPTLMTTGEIAQFRISKNRLTMITPESDSREREYEIVATTPRPDRPAPTQSASKD